MAGVPLQPPIQTSEFVRVFCAKWDSSRAHPSINVVPRLPQLPPGLEGGRQWL
jgi:hypothetical protein